MKKLVISAGITAALAGITALIAAIFHRKNSLTGGKEDVGI